MNARQAETKQIMQEVLNDEYLTLALDSYRIEENVELPSKIVAKVTRSDDQPDLVIEGGGVGSVHAFFVATRDRLAEANPSVQAIIFTSFVAKSVPGSGGKDPLDEEVEVSLEVQNSYNDVFTFTTRSPSLIRASLEAALGAVEYFANSERTYIKLYQVINHYKKEGRTDLIDKYTSMLGTVVRNTSYEEVSALLKRGEI